MVRRLSRAIVKVRKDMQFDPTSPDTKILRDVKGLHQGRSRQIAVQMIESSDLTAAEHELDAEVKNPNPQFHNIAGYILTRAEARDHKDQVLLQDIDSEDEQSDDDDNCESISIGMAVLDRVEAYLRDPGFLESFVVAVRDEFLKKKKVRIMDQINNY